MVKLSRTSLADTNIERVKAAVRLPTGLRMSSINLTLKFKPASGEDEVRNVKLAETNAVDPAAVAIKLRAGERLTVFHISPAEAASTAVFWARLKAAPKGTRSLEVNVREVCHTSPRPDQDLRFSTYLMTDELAEFVPILVDVDVNELARKSPEFRLLPCG